MLDFVTVQCQWDGSALRVRPVYGQGWELLTGSKRPLGRLYSMSLTELETTTAFELESALYSVMRQIGEEWDIVQREQHEGKRDQLRLVDESGRPPAE